MFKFNSAREMEQSASSRVDQYETTTTTTTSMYCASTFASTPISNKADESSASTMLLSPSVRQQFNYSTTTTASPLFSNNNNKLKSQNPYKMMNQSRVRAQSSPYSLAEYHHHHQNQRGSSGVAASNPPWTLAGVDSSVSSETDGDSSSLNQNVAHPTTPVSSLNESASATGASAAAATASGGGGSPSQQSSASSLPITAMLKKQDLMRSSTASSVRTTSEPPESVPHLTTPVTASDNSSPTSSSSRTGGLLLSSAGAASVEALTRSTSLGSLISDDARSIKSSYTSAAGSCLGIRTPAYSDLPDSPGGSPTQLQHHHPMQFPLNLVNCPIIAAGFDPAQFQPSYLLCNR